MDNDYAEIFCEAVDTILSKKLKELSFNTTIKGIITEIPKKDTKNIYKFLYNGYTYEATSVISESLEENDEVYVLILNNDYSANKIIIAKGGSNNV